MSFDIIERVIRKVFNKRIRALKRWLRQKQPYIVIGAILAVGSVIVYTHYMQNRRLIVDPATYAPLLQLIAQAESKGNYNAYFGNARNQSINFTKMSITDVMKWQDEHVRQGSASSAVGRYQIINTTLAGLVHQLDINTSHTFDQPMQDKLAVALIERRGSEQYVNGELTSEQFAASLAKEWAGLPKVIGDNPNHSYYASDGINAARVTVDQIKKAIEPIAPK